MRQQAFPKQELRRPPFLRRLFGKPDPENAYIEIQNLLHERPPKDISPELLTATFDAHGVTYPDKEKLRALYRKAIAAAAEDDEITDAERQELAEIRALLGLTELDVAAVQREVVSARYQHHLSRHASDHHLSDEEKQHLEELKRKLNLDSGDVMRVREAVLSPIVDRVGNDMLRDRRYSPEEELRFKRLLSNFDTELEVSLHDRQLMDRFRWLWHVEHGTPPTVDVPIALQRNEACYYHSLAASLTTKTVTKRVNYGGPTARMRIMKGVYYRVGSIAVQRVTEEYQLSEGGDLYFTNKRVIFVGHAKNQTFRLSGLLGFIPYSDGIELEKSSGKNPVFRLGDPEAAATVLSRMLADAGS